MTKREFKIFQLKIMLVDLFVFGLFIFLNIFSLFNQTINNNLFREGVVPKNLIFLLNSFLYRFSDGNDPLFFVIWMIIIFPLLGMNVYYFSVKSQYEKDAGIFNELEIKREKSKSRNFIILFFLTLSDMLLFNFVVYNNFFNKIFEIPHSEEILIFSFLTLPFLLASTIVTAVLKKSKTISK
jgi:hypothetical protein